MALSCSASSKSSQTSSPSSMLLVDSLIFCDCAISIRFEMDEIVRFRHVEQVCSGRLSAMSTVSDPDEKSQPTLLHAMMQYIRSELKLVGSASAMPGDSKRLQVYREAWDAFIHEFKTYKPILSEIKNEIRDGSFRHRVCCCKR
ncbi:hypothetical protein BC829DRAFT_46739 [Chytridium lagenaria]|nr:hypothetical protein BC829DRAFT_46739 [Chytridium lagenaria]